MGFLSGLIDKLKGEDAVDFTHFYLGEGAPAHVEKDKHYVRIWLRSARITEIRRWTKKFHATVHSQFTYMDSLSGLQEVMAVVAPDKAFEEMDPRHLDRFIVVNQPLLGPIPYRGELALDVALFSVSAADLAKPYLDLLTELTDSASVAFLGQVKPFVEPLKRGAEALLGDGDQAQLQIGLSRTDTQLRIGNILVARVPRGTISAAGLKVHPENCGLLDGHGNEVKGFPYLILGVEATTQRDDYPQIPDIKTGWEAVRQAAIAGKPVEEVREPFRALRRAISFSPDLIRTDKQRIIGRFSQELSDAGYDLEGPVEAAALEGALQRRPLRAAVDLLAPFEVAPRDTAGALEAAAAPAKPARISMAELQVLMADPTTTEKELRQYFIVDSDFSRPFAPSIMVDPSRVEVAKAADALEGAMAMDFANSLCRHRRKRKFQFRKVLGDRRQVLVSEGDSWFQFPIFLEDVIDQVLPDYNIWSVEAAGDTLQNMVLDNAEYMRALGIHRGEVRAFLFSGGGNDIVGEDAEGRPIVPQLLKPFEAGRPPEWYLDTDAFAAKLLFVEDCYRKVILNVITEYPDLPIICHGYDHAIPGGFPGDPRNPFWAKQDQWIGRAMREDLKIEDPKLQQAIVRLMIDRFNARQKALCGGNNPDGAFRNAWHVDCRGVVGNRWADELHPTNRGFEAVASRFLGVLLQAIAPSMQPVALEGAVEGGGIHVCGDDGVDPLEMAPEWALHPFETLRSWRVAACLKQLKQQVDANAPGRRRQSDGTIGDPAHQSRKSDHNPWVEDQGMGVVTAMDITHDPEGGCDANKLAEAICSSRDPRVKYLIWNRQIASYREIGGAPAWAWRPYNGSNPHTKHVHISVRPEKTLYDATDQWLV